MKESIDITHLDLLDQRLFRQYLLSNQAVLEGNQRLALSLRPLLLALADIAQDTPALAAAYRLRLAEAERLTGEAPQPLIPID